MMSRMEDRDSSSSANGMSEIKITGRDPRSGHLIDVIVEDGVIVRIENAIEPALEKTKSRTDVFISSGFVDLQVNGYAGSDLNAENISTGTVVDVVDAVLAHGVTCFAPTLITAPEEAICSRLKVIAAARSIHPRVRACIPFVHVEGPHISAFNGYRGVHPVDAVRPPSVAEFDRWQKAAGGIVGLVTLSPHFADSGAYIAALVNQGVHIAIGHTHASAEQIEQAADAGASLSTHLGNGIAQEISRHQNPLWSQLADDRLTATFIADGHHLPADVLKAMLRAKGIARSILVSDSVALAGRPAGTYTTPVGGRVELRPDGRLCLFGSELLAGSTASLAQCIGKAVRMTGMPLSDALTMATANPARYAKRKGQLAIGARADLVRFQWRDEVVIEDVWLAGELVYKRGTSAPPIQ
jgi:N-acetylglucosamine-6-phosphate deacetylase